MVNRSLAVFGVILLAVGVSIAFTVIPSHLQHHSTAKLKLATAPTTCLALDAGALPDPKCTPGYYNHAVTQKTIKTTICKVGWTSTIRPPVSITEPLKGKLVRAYGYGNESLRDFELDHLVPLELGGNPIDQRNLWPELHHVIFNGKEQGAYVKDGVENSLNAKVCNGTMKLAAARREMAKGTWIQ